VTTQIRREGRRSGLVGQTRGILPENVIAKNKVTAKLVVRRPRTTE